MEKIFLISCALICSVVVILELILSSSDIRYNIKNFIENKKLMLNKKNVKNK